MKKELVNMEKVDPSVRLKKGESIRYVMGTLDYMVGELEKNMKEEGRCRGIVLSYLDTMKSFYREFYDNFYVGGEKDTEGEGKLMFLLKPIYHKELWRLNKRGLSRADAIITLLHKTLGFITKGSPFEEEASGFVGVIKKLFDNIKTRSKGDLMFSYSNAVQEIILKGYQGKYELEVFVAFPERPGCRVQEEELSITDKKNSWEKEL